MKNPVRLWAASLVCLFAAGCASAPPAPRPYVADLFHDARFGAPSEPVSTERLFALSAPMTAYLNSEIFRGEVQRKGAEMGLVDALYDRQSLRLDYDGSATRDAAATFAAKRGNCLSLVIMTAAFAKALKLEIAFQDVQIDTEWSRNGELYVGNTHVNLSVVTPSTLNTNNGESLNRITIDFVPPPQAGQQRMTRISENMIVAMYLNNRAAEEFSHQRLDNAYWWARAAVEREPNFVAGYNTLAVVYQKRGEQALAERVYKRALALAPNDTVLMTNLAPLLAQMGKTAESRALAARAASLEPEPPFHFFERGMLAMENGRYAEARQMFGREVRRSPYNHEFHYWLAMAHLRLGEARAARDEMAIALNNSTSTDASARYSSKLAALRAMK
jgi:Tfp pilus assembly protein PilF